MMSSSLMPLLCRNERRILLVVRSFLHSKGITDTDIMEEYTPFGHSDYQTIIAKIKKFASEGKKTAVVSTINGDSNVPFYKELGNQGLKATDVPVVAFSVGEEELRGVDTKPLVGHCGWNYFESIKNPTNAAFIKQWTEYSIKKGIPGHKDKPLTTTDGTAYIGIHMWAQAVEKAKSTDTDKVIAAMAGQTFAAPGGFTSTMDAKNHHLHKPVFIGEDQERRPVQRRLEDRVRSRLSRGARSFPRTRARRTSPRRSKALPRRMTRRAVPGSTAGRRDLVSASPDRLAPVHAATNLVGSGALLLGSIGTASFALTDAGAGDRLGRQRPADRRTQRIGGGATRLAVFVKALLDDEVGRCRKVIVHDGKASDAATGAETALPKAPRTSPTTTACAARSRRRSPGCACLPPTPRSSGSRRRARRASLDESQLRLIEKAFAAEANPGLRKSQLERMRGTILISSSDRSKRLAAAGELAGSNRAPSRACCRSGSARAAGRAEVRAAAAAAAGRCGRDSPGASGWRSCSPASASVRCSSWSRSAWRSPTA